MQNQYATHLHFVKHLVSHRLVGIRLAIFLCCLLSCGLAEASLQVFPLRVVLSDKERTAQLTLRHTGDQPKSYRISTVFYRMDENGAMTRIPEIDQIKPGERPALGFFRYSPRQVKLTPQVEQTVRLVLRQPAGLEEGDYRAHIYFEESDDVVTDVATTENDKATFVLKARVAVAVPVVVRVGQPKSKVTLGQPKISRDADGKQVLVFDLAQEGKAFAYGDFVAKVPAKDGAPERSIGLMLGVSSYLPKREVRFPLKENFDKRGFSTTDIFKNASLPIVLTK
jgi:hypothetical protein